MMASACVRAQRTGGVSSTERQHAGAVAPRTDAASSARQARTATTWETPVPTTQYFTPQQLRRLRSEMEEDFAQQLRAMTNEHAYGPSSVNDALCPELTTESDEVGAALHAHLQARLAAITSALRRFDTGAYGECARCGSRISFSRLAVMPETTFCIDCGGA